MNSFILVFEKGKEKMAKQIFKQKLGSQFRYTVLNKHVHGTTELSFHFHSKKCSDLIRTLLKRVICR
jgi:hypothetical protein